LRLAKKVVPHCAEKIMQVEKRKYLGLSRLFGAPPRSLSLLLIALQSKYGLSTNRESL